ncbi:methionine gamma-lyase [Undibacterium squillarum]|uniref:L-methionine gamma-lyase n=1 Tax=Undibacterium squillarum TaxID=1131567 RepID=A0ABQ2Y240_9BURK|nr:methionine gamma-lyase [Undibacterium squillarum]GGX51478.1 methionine gamma-lyase [Undibacterium squillarum]
MQNESQAAHSHETEAGFDTRAIHFGYDAQAHQGALVPPLFQTSTFSFPNIEYGAKCFAGEEKGHFYTRISNPTLALFEGRMASLEQGGGAVAFGSGMGAVTATLWTMLEPGDDLIADITLYGCTFAFFNAGLAKFGINLTYVDMNDHAALQKALAASKAARKVVYFETPANPNMRMVDIPAVCALATQYGAKTVVDNTYCTPYLQRPLTMGADVVLHSATKYLGGHGDLIAGVAVFKDPELALNVRVYGLKDMTGAALSPHDAQLIMRGMKTLSLRLERHCDSAEIIAEKLQKHTLTEVVYYPGLKSFPQHELAKRQMKRFGGMIAFELKGGLEAGIRFMNALKLISRAVSLGDAESLAQHPASMTHATYTPEQRAAHGISDGLVRLSVGLEDVADIWADIEQALRAV